MDVNDALSRYIEAATGITKVTKSRAEQIVKNLKQGGGRNPQELVEELLERSQDNRQALASMVRSESKKAVAAMGLATRADVERLERQLAELRRAVAPADQQAVEPVPGRRAGGEQPAEETSGVSGAEQEAKQTAADVTVQHATPQPGAEAAAAEGAGEPSSAEEQAKQTAADKTGGGEAASS
jgi:polyhydroxyalkanoate synthesis regulator phasin